MAEGVVGTSIRIIFLIFNVLIVISGLGCVGVGIWMHADKDIEAYLTVLRRSPRDHALVSGASLLIAAGFLMVIFAVLGFFSIIKNNKLLLRLYIFLLVIGVTMQLTTGFLLVHFKYDLHRSIQRGMKNDIRNEYDFDNAIGRAWNRVQVRRRCCGAFGSWDYQNSKWWHKENPGVSDPNEALANVPASCCKVNQNYDTDVSRVDTQSPPIKHNKNCQQDAAGRKDGSNFLNGRGCYAALLARAYHYYNALLAIGLTVGFFQFINLGVAIFLAVHMQRALQQEKSGMR
ncbi:hypothetical protein NP493_760g01046 [Ridgeia piscesae]|uniref:Tetraspanin n=1 Tax=Ridgeia piscesae TaxID=27915 RepID=A0AAD9KQK1_RIDPI|nr:hypothetical protein NP493_760g01046 [Ridgeia piscesae]